MLTAVEVHGRGLFSAHERLPRGAGASSGPLPKGIYPTNGASPNDGRVLSGPPLSRPRQLGAADPQKGTDPEELLDPSVRHAVGADVQLRQVGVALAQRQGEVPQSPVGDVGAEQVEPPQVAHPGQHFHALIADLGMAECQHLQPVEAQQRGQPPVRDRAGVVEVQDGEILNFLREARPRSVTWCLAQAEGGQAG